MSAAKRVGIVERVARQQLEVHNDRAIGVSTAGLRSKGEFLRSPGGEIEWFRWGGRIARKQATDD